VFNYYDYYYDSRFSVSCVGNIALFSVIVSFVVIHNRRVDCCIVLFHSVLRHISDLWSYVALLNQ